MDSLIRATGEIRIPKTVKVADSTIQEHAKNATAPYKFFELEDVGLSVVDDEEGMVVAGVKADTPFGNCGVAKGGHHRRHRRRPARPLGAIPEGRPAGDGPPG